MANVIDFDRRWIFLAMGVLVVSLYAMKAQSDAPQLEYVQAYYDVIEALPDDSVVLLSADFDPASAAELLPMYQATIHHLLRKDIRIVNVATWPAAPPYTRNEFNQITPLYNKSYGTDWVELGFLPGDDVAMAQIGNSIHSAFAQDSRKKQPIADFPLMDELGDSLEGVDLLITLSAGYPGILEWLAQVGGRYNKTIITGTTAVQTSDLYAFYPSQLAGFLGGATAATRYLELVSEQTPELDETREINQNRIMIQEWAHMFILALIAVGNVLYFIGRGK
ncbi:MAG: hypothetical protein ACI9EF_003493 [Pseudohongiellaceae bacterium]|jgi:hypothetical protein